MGSHNEAPPALPCLYPICYTFSQTQNPPLDTCWIFSVVLETVLETFYFPNPLHLPNGGNPILPSQDIPINCIMDFHPSTQEKQHGRRRRSKSFSPNLNETTFVL